jgi:hypothetical protein
MVLLALPDFNVWGEFQPIEGAKMLLFAFLLILFLEYKIFGYQIILTVDSLLYRSSGFPSFSTSTFQASQITSFRAVYFDKSKRIRSAFIELMVNGNKEFINIASFNGIDIKTIEKWLLNNTKEVNS